MATLKVDGLRLLVSSHPYRRMWLTRCCKYQVHQDTTGGFNETQPKAQRALCRGRLAASGFNLESDTLRVTSYLANSIDHSITRSTASFGTYTSCPFSARRPPGNKQSSPSLTRNRCGVSFKISQGISRLPAQQSIRSIPFPRSPVCSSPRSRAPTPPRPVAAWPIPDFSSARSSALSPVVRRLNLGRPPYRARLVTLQVPSRARDSRWS
jgi:hypothetical protein